MAPVLATSAAPTTTPSVVTTRRGMDPSGPAVA
jgi:hypothetical protein